MSRAQSRPLSPTVADLEALTCDDDAVRAIADLFRSHGYSVDALNDVLSIAGPPAQLITRTALCSLVYYDETAAGRSALHTLAMLFALGGQVHARDYRRWVPPGARLVLERYRLVEQIESDAVTATVSVVEFGAGLLFADKQVEREPDAIRILNLPDHADQANYVSLATGNNLFRHCARPPGSSERPLKFLDIGCGNSCLSFMARRARPQAMAITAIDISSRALAFSRLNEAVNRSIIDVRNASCYDVLGGEPYDYVVFNSPTMPRYKPDLVNINSYSRELGQDFLFEFLNRRLPALLGDQGAFQGWGAICVPRATPSISNLFRQQFDEIDRYDVHLVVESIAPWSLSARDVQAGRIRRDSALLVDPDDAEQFMAFVRDFDIARIAPVHLFVTPRTGTTAVLVEHSVDSLVPWA